MLNIFKKTKQSPFITLEKDIIPTWHENSAIKEITIDLSTKEIHNDKEAAIVYENGYEEFYLYGKQLTDIEFYNIVKI